MNEKFENQKETLLSIKQEISLLYQQVNYLLRNEKPLELLDLDVLMNRTHTLYDQLCAINVGDDSLEEDLPFTADDFSGLFGAMAQEETTETSDTEVAEEEVPEEVHEEVHEEVREEFPEEETATEEVEEPIENQVVEMSVEVEQPAEPEPDEMQFSIGEEQPQKMEADETETSAEEKPLGDDFGLFFRFEEAPEVETPQEILPETQQKMEVNEGKVVHVMEEIPEEDIPERDRVHGDDLVKDNPLIMPRLDEERMAEKEEIERESSDVFNEDDAEFELSTGETLGERMMGEDHSLAAKLQQTPGRDLKSVIGINDKFLFVNELFGGSMEKYNKSIENLNDLKTLNGAMIYLNELKIELQWNSSNEAYMKLKDLVSRKFE
ncbi:MAG: hypothetical protein IKN08_04305 [Bacteroidales bacterium]|nr:hypothetical protein [Bacteroidales bacterium]MBR6930205.1 hypothetical protein [Bacteroidales bacterium]